MPDTYVIRMQKLKLQVAWRGTVLESQVSASAKNAFVDKFTFYHSEGIQVILFDEYF
jgi:hypothetical protein